MLLVDRVESRAEETLAIIQAEGGEASTFQGDMTSLDDCQRMAQAAVDRGSRHSQAQIHQRLPGIGPCEPVSDPARHLPWRPVPGRGFLPDHPFKLFNKIETWELLQSKLETVAYEDFTYDQ